MGLFRTSEKEVPEIRSAGDGVVPPTRSTLPSVNPDSAMTLSAVYRSVSVIAATISQLPMACKRADTPIAIALAKRPNLNSIASEFWSQTVVSLALNGNAYWYVQRGTTGAVNNLTVLRPSQVNVLLQDDGSVFGKLVYHVNGKEVSSDKIKHLRLLSMPGEHIGLGPIQAARQDLQTALALREFGDSVLSTGGIPTGVLSTDQKLNQDQSNAYRDAWNEAQKERGLAVLGAGLEYQPIALSPADMQWLENKTFSNSEIARMFGIPAIWLGLGIEGSSMTYTNVEMLAQEFLTTTGSQYLTVIEQNFSDLLPRGTESRFKTDALLRGDAKSRADVYAILHGLGAITTEEIRISEGLDGPVANDGSPV